MRGCTLQIVGILLLIVDLFIEQCSCERAHASRKRRSPLEEFRHHEVVTPVLYHSRQRRSTTSLGSHHVETARVEVTAFNNNFSLHIHLNRDFIPSTYIEKFFLEDGSPVIRSPHNHHQHHCYYHGNIEGVPDSLVAVSTCQGIRGVVWDLKETYYIEPAVSLAEGQHYVFRHSDRHHTNYSCGHGDDVSWKPHVLRNLASNVPKNNKRTRLKRSPHWPYDTNKDTRILELYIANDFKQYDSFDRELNQVITRTKEIVNIVNSLYRQLDIYVALVGMEIWTSGDQVKVVNSADTTMNNFLTYRKKSICPSHRNDNAQLITGHDFLDNVVGKALKSTICSYQYSGGVNMDHSSLVGPVATTVAHEIGHNFGFQHDDHTCKCPTDRCIMAMSSGPTNPVHWSSCSKEQLDDAFHQGLDYCLNNLPDELYGSPTCGNGFLEDGEECDCGLIDDCHTKCCNASNCQLTVNATCATGACCDLNTCQFEPKSTLCRASAGECDLAEYCHGDTEHCPSDVYMKQGTECAGGKAFCFEGMCRTHDTQCQKLWGKTAHMAHPQCFKYFNILGQASGHCGFNWVDTEFAKCAEKDAMCGMLFCNHRNEKLMFWKEALSYTMPEPWVMVNRTRQECKAAILDVGLNMPDPGMTPDGVKCGENEMCLKAKCTAVDSLDVPKCPVCNGHGVCNSLGQCHCDCGYGPPHCDKTGYGGSMHSGPVCLHNKNWALITGLCIFFLLIVPLLVVGAFFFYRYRVNIKKLWNQRPRPYKYETKAKPPEAPSKPPPSRPIQPPASKPKPPPVQRFSSFREMPISMPRLESSTNQTPAEKMTVVGPTKAIQERPLPAVPPGGPGEPSKPMPTRPPPRVPNYPPASPPPEQPVYSRPLNLPGLKSSSSSPPPGAPPEGPPRPPPTYKEIIPNKPEYENEVPLKHRKPPEPPVSPPALPERPKADSSAGPISAHKLPPQPGKPRATEPTTVPSGVEKENNANEKKVEKNMQPNKSQGPADAKRSGSSVSQARRRFEQKGNNNAEVAFKPKPPTKKPGNPNRAGSQPGSGARPSVPRKPSQPT